MEYEVVLATDVNDLRESLKRLAKENFRVTATVDKLVILERKVKSKDKDDDDDEDE